MGRLSTRVLFGASGVLLAALYVVVAYVLVALIVVAWARRPRPALIALAVAASTLAVGYLDYRAGVRGILRAVDATVLPRERAPGVHDLLDRVAAEMDVARPRLLVMHTGVPNALALGGSPGTVVVDASLLRLLDRQEMAAVLAHELAHIERRDAFVQTVGATFVGTVSTFVFVVLLPAGLVAVAIRRTLATFAGYRRRSVREQGSDAFLGIALVVSLVMVALTLPLRAHSRRRELSADDRAAGIVGPAAMARALARIDAAAGPERGVLSPLVIHGNEEGTLTRLLATHPPMDRRIRRLLDRIDDDRRRATARERIRR